MPKNELIERFYRTLSNTKFKDLSYEKVNEICLFPYEYFRRRMSSNDIPDIRIKYFGSFQVFAAPILKEINVLNKKKESAINEGREMYPYHQKSLEKLEAYVQDNPKVFIKNVKRKNTSD